MLELGMDMEADLGIDSIKRVEIFGAMTAAHPEIQGINPQELAELRTLQQIVHYIAGKAGATAPVTTPPVVAAPASQAPPANGTQQSAPPVVPTAQAPASIEQSKIENTLLIVIAEKTGYPAEMLELTMDMEADLGIDSIKRVEIFGAMTAAHPEIQGIIPQELAELRTLQQIVQYIAGKAGATVPSPTPPAAAVPASQIPTANGSQQPAPPVVPTAQAPVGIEHSIIENTLLTVIAEKTGYPAEMLELTMDMEADLGIDSIKRVEIFGAMTAAHPEIKGIIPQELAELRTLQQIVFYIAGKAGAVLEVAEGKK
jgi:acyl carrier protein